MLEPWNDKAVRPPPIHTSICNNNIDLKMLKYVLNNIINTLTKQSPLHNESAIFSRLLYKFDKKFRHDIGYRNFKKVNCALRRYLSLNLIKDVEEFTSVLPEEEDTPYYLPTKQMLQYILVRVIAFSKLMIRIIVCSKQAAVFYLDRVKRGEKHWMSLMPYALLSRVWSMTLVLLQHSCSWYEQLYSFLDVLQLKGLNFLPDGYMLPTKLSDWLRIKDINNFGRFEWSHKKIINGDAMLINDDGDNFENILQYVNQINENLEDIQNPNLQIVKNPVKDIIVAPIEKHDLGEVISRDTFAKFMNKENKKSIGVVEKKNDYFHVIDSVTDKHSLQRFIDNEEAFRNEGNNRSLTNHLTFMQWQCLKTSVLKLDQLTLNNRKLQRKFQKIWQAKCLDIE